MSTTLSAEVANRISANNVLSNAIAPTSSQISVEILNRQSADNVLSNTISNEISNRISADNALSNFISANFGNQISILSVAIANSVWQRPRSRRTSRFCLQMHRRLSTNISILSANVSALSTQISAAGGFQQAVVGNTQSISLSALTQISGFSISVAANGVYTFEGLVFYNVSATSGSGLKLALAASGFTTQNLGGYWQAVSTIQGGGGGVAMSMWPFNNIASTTYSILSNAAATINWARFQGVLALSTTGGTLVVQGLTTIGTNSLYIYKGSYIKAFKIA